MMKNDTIEDSMIEREVANPLRMLSAYFMTTATMIPPSAWGGGGGGGGGGVVITAATHSITNL